MRSVQVGGKKIIGYGGERMELMFRESRGENGEINLGRGMRSVKVRGGGMFERGAEQVESKSRMAGEAVTNSGRGIRS